MASQQLRSGAAFTFGGFNELNLPANATTPVGTLTLGYDLQGRLVSQTATHAQGDPYDARFTRDALGRVRETHYGKSQEYSANYDYDKLGPLTSATFSEALGSFTVSSTLYPDGRRHTVNYPSGQTVLTEDRDNG